MGLFDDIEVDGRKGQVKLWDCTMSVYRKGDKAPGLPRSYSIAMREGGYVNITNDIIDSWTDEPAHSDVFDKWGAHFRDDGQYWD